MSETKDEMKQYALRLPAELYRRIALLADREQRSMNAQIIVELQRAVDREQVAGERAA